MPFIVPLKIIFFCSILIFCNLLFNLTLKLGRLIYLEAYTFAADFLKKSNLFQAFLFNFL